LYPDVAAEWHPTRNGDLLPTEVLGQSNRRVWWHCRAGHEWATAVAHRTGQGTGCPYCAGQLPTPERNLAVISPEVAAEWHPARNGDLLPTEVLGQSNRRVRWRCQAGHDWQAIVASRSRGHGCPLCAGSRPTGDHNLAVVHPDLAAEWHPTRNGDRHPEEVTPRSPQQAWWRCAAGHEWAARVTHRANGSGCPYCAGRLPTAERNLVVLYPDVAAEWHPSLNGGLVPTEVLPNSTRKVWWRCPAGHAWPTRVNHRTRRGSGCPACADSSKKGIPLAQGAPRLLDEWDVTLNGGRGDDVAAGSARRAWWRCRNDATHLWRAKVANRNKGKTGCPYCAGKLPTAGRNLAVVHPDLAVQWHPSGNGDLSPTDLLPSTNRKVWWHCDVGHEWGACVNNRAKGTGCPYCAGQLPTPDHNLAVVSPALAAQWHPTGNGDRRPEEVTPCSNERVGWRCPTGHEWEASPHQRSAGDGCPICAGVAQILDPWIHRRLTVGSSRGPLESHRMAPRVREA
jgi:hypothetical protein